MYLYIHCVSFISSFSLSLPPSHSIPLSSSLSSFLSLPLPTSPSQSWELLLKALTDPSQLVVSTAYSVLLPALAAWAFELDILESDMLSYFLHQTVTCIKVGGAKGRVSGV